MAMTPEQLKEYNKLKKQSIKLAEDERKLNANSATYEQEIKKLNEQRIKLQEKINKLLGQERGILDDITSSTKSYADQLGDIGNTIQKNIKGQKIYKDLNITVNKEAKIYKGLLAEAEKKNSNLASSAGVMGDVVSNITSMRTEQLDNEMRLGTAELESLNVEYLRDKLLAAKRAYQADSAKMSAKEQLNGLEYLRVLEDSVVHLDKAAILTDKIKETSSGMANQIMEPFDKMKSALSDLPGGGLLSNVLGLDTFGAAMKKNVTIAMQTALVKGPQAGLAIFKKLTLQVFAMLGPVALIGIAVAAIAAVFVGISKSAKELSKEAGVTFAQAKNLNDQARQVQGQYSTQLATMEDITAVQKEQIVLLGSASLVNTEIAGKVAETGRAYGYGAEQAGKTHAALMLMGEEQGRAAELQMKINAVSLKAGVNVAGVQKDIADNSKVALKYISGGGEQMANAAIQAAKMGVTLSQMVKVADGLLDIESSLSAQFEFQALTGNQIDLDLARQKALTGDIAGATEAVLDNVKSSADFDEMGVFAKQALAKATGLEVGELQKALLVKEKLGKLNAEEQAAMANLGLSAAEMKDMNAKELQNKLAQQQSIDKAGAAFESIKNQLTTALLPLAEAFGAVFTLLGPVIKMLGIALQGAFYPLTLAGQALKVIVDLIEKSVAASITLAAVFAGLLAYQYKSLIVEKATLAISAIRGVFAKKELVTKGAVGVIEKKGFFKTLAGAAMTAFKSAASIPVIGPLLGAAAAATAVGLGMKLIKKAGDVQSPAKGKTQISTKEGGLFETSKNDDVAAGPGLLSKLAGAATNPLGAIGGLFGDGDKKSSDMKRVEELLQELIFAARTPPPVYIGDKAITELNTALQINDSFQTTKVATAGV